MTNSIKVDTQLAAEDRAATAIGDIFELNNDIACIRRALIDRIERKIATDGVFMTQLVTILRIKEGQLQILLDSWRRS